MRYKNGLFEQGRAIGIKDSQKHITELQDVIKEAVNMADMAGHMLSINSRHQCFNIANYLRPYIRSEVDDAGGADD